MSDLRLNRSGNRRGFNAKHGESKDGAWTPEYRAWMGMKGRCYNRNNHKYPRYGGRGITVCEQWLGENGFATFLAHIGRRPSPQHSIDRFPNNDGNYEPGNVRWATKGEQSKNKSDTRFLSFNGRTLCIADWSRETGISEATIRFRLKAGWTIGRTLVQPLTRGDLHGKARLTAEDVRSIKRRVANGERQAVLAREHKVVPSTISHVARGRNWKVTT